MNRILLVCFALFTGTISFAQIQMRSPQAMAYTGQPVPLRISQKGTLADSLPVPDSIGRLEVLRFEKAVQQGDSVIQDVLLIGYDSGSYALPQIAGKIESLPDSILLLPMPQDSLAKYGDVKTYFAGKETTNYWPYLWAALGALACIALLWWVLRRKRNKALQIDNPITGPKHWQEQMQKLQQNWQAGKLSAPVAATQCMQLVRAMLQLKGIPTAALTGEELLPLAKSILPAQQQTALQEAVGVCYGMQFARMHPAQEIFSQQLQQVAAVAAHTFQSSNPEAKS